MEQPVQIGSRMQWTVLKADVRKVVAVKAEERRCNVQAKVGCGFGVW